jgi:glycosyltransferase involved in cell wall biosynthesis
MEVKVSVVMTAFNAEKYLSEAIQSVLDQTLTDFEFIIANDGSTDNSLSIMNEFQKKDRRIIIDDHENMGMAESVNRILKFAKSDLIARMDADDIMMPERLRIQYDFMINHPEVSMVSSDVEMIGEEGQSMGVQGNIKNLQSAEDTKRYVNANKVIYFPHTACTFRKDHVTEVGGYDGQYWPSDDIELFNRLAENYRGVVVLPMALMKYRIHGSSVMTSKYFNMMRKLDWVVDCVIKRRRGEKVLTLPEFLKSLEERPFLSKLNWYRKRYADFYMRNAGFYAGSKNYVRAGINLALAMLLKPLSMLPRIGKNLKSRFNIVNS